MHDPSREGAEFFVCDFCRRPWSDDRPMVEGHRGSLICANCLRVAYTELVLTQSPSVYEVESCTMCLEQRRQPGWRSPLFEEAVVCLRCIKQSATVFEKDPDLHWTRPA